MGAQARVEMNMASYAPGKSARMPSLILTLDVEGDDAWAGRLETQTRNAAFLPRFQQLCERYGFAPTYLTNYEMAMDPSYCEFAKDAVERGKAEIGMHLHAWNSPPLESLTENDSKYGPYLIEYPRGMTYRKIEFMTRFLEDRFSVPMVSHRAGRWALDAYYIQVLTRFGYRADCSVTPHVDWRGNKGAFAGGSDYRSFPACCYWIGGDDISRPAESDLLEVPMTIVDRSPRALGRIMRTAPKGLPQRVLRRLWPLEWMRPNGHNLKSMLRILNRATREEWPYVEFMLHSSELMPGGSPTFRDEAAIEHLYEDLSALFQFARSRFQGRTLGAFRESIRASNRFDRSGPPSRNEPVEMRSNSLEPTIVEPLF